MKINVLLEMSNILIGSSNVYRHYKVNLVSGAKQYLMVKCTQSEVFNATMASLGEKDKFVLISVIKNFISDAVGSTSEKPEPLFESCINADMKVIKETSLQLPESKFGFALPMDRPALLWYQEGRPQITRMIKEKLREILKEAGTGNVMRIKCGSSASQQFENNMVHLTVLAAKIFLEVMLESAKDYFNVALTNPEQDNGEYNGTETETDTDVEELVQKVQELEKKFKLQNEKYTSYDLMFARIREEVDSTLNKLKENRVFINKLKSVTPFSVRFTKVSSGTLVVMTLYIPQAAL
jgi:hypothetical protein